MYRPSDTLLGAWATWPIYNKKNVLVGNRTLTLGVVDILVGERELEIHDWRMRVLGHPLSADYDGNGLHNLCRVKIAPIWIGWTRDGGKTIVGNETLITRHGLVALDQVLESAGARPNQINTILSNERHPNEETH